MNRSRAKTAALAGAGGGTVEEPVAEVSDTGRGSARREKFQRAFERYGVPGVSLLGPLLLPTQFTATMLAASASAGRASCSGSGGDHRMDHRRRRHRRKRGVRHPLTSKVIRPALTTAHRRARAVRPFMLPRFPSRSVGSSHPPRRRDERCDDGPGSSGRSRGVPWRCSSRGWHPGISDEPTPLARGARRRDRGTFAVRCDGGRRALQRTLHRRLRPGRTASAVRGRHHGGGWRSAGAHRLAIPLPPASARRCWRPSTDSLSTRDGSGSTTGSRPGSTRRLSRISSSWRAWIIRGRSRSRTCFRIPPVSPTTSRARRVRGHRSSTRSRPIPTACSLPRISWRSPANTRNPSGVPGTVFAYSDTGYLLLGVVLERLEGKTYAEILQDRLFERWAWWTATS